MTPVTPIAPITDRLFERLAVVGAGNMGSGIAQKMATEGFAVTLVDLDDQKVARGLGIIDQTLEDGVQRAIFEADEVAAIRGAAARDIPVRRSCRRRPGGRGGVRGSRDQEERLSARSTRSAGRTRSSPPTRLRISVTELAAATTRPERVSACTTSIIRRRTASSRSSPARATDPAVLRRAWRAPGSARQDPDRLERLLRLHRQSVLRRRG